MRGLTLARGGQTRDARSSHPEEVTMPKVPQPVTDDSVRVRQVNHYQFTWVAGEPGEKGTFTLQLVLDQGAWEEIVTVDAEDADVLQDLLSGADIVTFDISRRTLMFGTVAVGST
jgi:hypothetical protein